MMTKIKHFRAKHDVSKPGPLLKSIVKNEGHVLPLLKCRVTRVYRLMLYINLNTLAADPLGTRLG